MASNFDEDEEITLVEKTKKQEESSVSSFDRVLENEAAVTAEEAVATEEETATYKMGRFLKKEKRPEVVPENLPSVEDFIESRSVSPLPLKRVLLAERSALHQKLDSKKIGLREIAAAFGVLLSFGVLLIIGYRFFKADKARPIAKIEKEEASSLGNTTFNDRVIVTDFVLGNKTLGMPTVKQGQNISFSFYVDSWPENQSLASFIVESRLYEHTGKLLDYDPFMIRFTKKVDSKSQRLRVDGQLSVVKQAKLGPYRLVLSVVDKVSGQKSLLQKRFRVVP